MDLSFARLLRRSKWKIKRSITIGTEMAMAQARRAATRRSTATRPRTARSPRPTTRSRTPRASTATTSSAATARSASRSSSTSSPSTTRTSEPTVCHNHLGRTCYVIRNKTLKGHLYWDGSNKNRSILAFFNGGGWIYAVIKEDSQ